MSLRGGAVAVSGRGEAPHRHWDSRDWDWEGGEGRRVDVMSSVEVAHGGAAGVVHL